MTEAAKLFLIEKGYDPQYGARPLKRAIQKYLEDELAEVVIREENLEGVTLQIDVNQEKDGLKIRH
jgi:ATP-dependent Clp protease ATP-binding subunit ClpC